MVQSPWAANWFAASQEIPRISQNLKVHYSTHKCPPPVPILGQPNPVHIPTSHLLEIHPNIIHSSTPRSPQWSPSLRFPHQDPIHSPLLTHTRHMPSPSHSSRLPLTEKNTVRYMTTFFLCYTFSVQLFYILYSWRNWTNLWHSTPFFYLYLHQHVLARFMAIFRDSCAAVFQLKIILFDYNCCCVYNY